MSVIIFYDTTINQTINIDVTHAARALTLYWHLGPFIAKHLK